MAPARSQASKAVACCCLRSLGTSTGLAHYFVTPEGRRTDRKASLFKRWVIDEVTDATRCIAERGQEQARSSR